jgi:hypothetical protein
MSDDVETILAGLERRVQQLQAELGDVPEQPPPPAPPPPETPPAAPDSLERFGADLRRLCVSYERLLAEMRGTEGLLFSGDVALDATTDFTGLCELKDALDAIPGVTADLRAYAGGRAALDLSLERSVALVAELRRTLRLSVSVVEAREGRLTIEVGRVAPGGG